MRTTRKHYTASFKQQAIELVMAGRAVSEIARDLEIEPSCLYSWVRESNRKPGVAQAVQPGSGVLPASGGGDAADELRRLRRENAELRLDNEILKKAAVIIGTKIQPNDAR